jgi:hypothetical protein
LRGGEGDQFQQIALADAVHADEADEVGVGIELDRQVGEVAPALDISMRRIFIGQRSAI